MKILWLAPAALIASKFYSTLSQHFEVYMRFSEDGDDNFIEVYSIAQLPENQKGISAAAPPRIGFIEQSQMQSVIVWEHLHAFDLCLVETQSPEVWLGQIERLAEQAQRLGESQQILDSYTTNALRLEMLLQINQSISLQKPLGDLFAEIMKSSRELMEAEASSLLLYEDRSKELVFQEAQGDKGELVRKYSVQVGQGIAGWVAAQRKAALVTDCYGDERFDPSYDKRTGFVTRDMVCVPMMQQGELIGVLQVINKREGNTFDGDDLALLETLAAQCAIAITNARITRLEIDRKSLAQELATARQIQLKALPQKLPAITNIDIAATLVPANEVGGDYYHFFRLDGKHSLWVMADVSGKGIPAGLIVSTLHAAISTFISSNPGEIELSELVRAVNKVIIANTTIHTYATAWFGLYHEHEERLESINAGHNYPIWRSADAKQLRYLEAGGVFLGAYDLPYEKEELQLKKGEILVVYTDGVTEAWDSAGNDYGEARFELWLRHCSGTAEQMLAKLKKDVTQHVNGAAQSDDFTCFVVQRT
jgi:sigma-B regulation protein RsbU (phosphoserine phosphatase)